jgi:hypothetical protein
VFIALVASPVSFFHPLCELHEGIQLCSFSRLQPATKKSIPGYRVTHESDEQPFIDRRLSFPRLIYSVETPQYLSEVVNRAGALGMRHVARICPQESDRTGISSHRRIGRDQRVPIWPPTFSRPNASSPTRYISSPKRLRASPTSPVVNARCKASTRSTCRSCTAVSICCFA